MEKKTIEKIEVKPIELKPIEGLKELDLGDTNAFVCDLETGICGPADKVKEKSE